MKCDARIARPQANDDVITAAVEGSPFTKAKTHENSDFADLQRKAQLFPDERHSSPLVHIAQP